MVCHSKRRAVKVSDVVHNFIVPNLFPCIAIAWMQCVRHLWEITKTSGAKGPAYPIMMLRTEQRGVYGTDTFVEYMKTSNIAFAQWIAGESGKREHLQWDTGTMPVGDQPTLASLLRIAEGLAYNQGVLASTNPTALRALASLQAAMNAAGAA